MSEPDQSEEQRSEAHQSEEPLAEAYPLGEGAFIGVGAYVAGVAVTFLLLMFDSGFRQETKTMDASLLDGILWSYYQGHLVELTVSPTTPGVERQSVNVVSQLGSGTALLVYLVPVVVLFVAGYIVAKKGDAKTRVEGTISGGLVTLGYLPMAALGVFVSRTTVTVQRDTPLAVVAGIDGQFTATAVPEIDTAVVFAGVLFPVIFGALGGFAFSQRERKKDGA